MNRRTAVLLALLSGVCAIGQTVTITTPSPLPAGYAGFAYSMSLAASVSPPGGTLTWSIPVGTPQPPSALQLSSAGVLSGTLNGADAGSYTFTVQASYSTGPNAVQTSMQFSLNVVTPKVSIISPASPLPSAIGGQAYSQIFTASNNTPYVVNWSMNPNPPGLTMSTAGVLSGIPTGIGTTQFTVSAFIPQSEVFDNVLYTITEYAGQVAITTKSLPLATVNQAYTAFVQGTPTGITWSELATTNPPPGIGFVAANAAFTGTPATPGAYSVGVSASAANYLGAQMTYPFYVTNGPLSITQSSVPAAAVNQPYQTTLTATGGLGPFTWSLSNTGGFSIAPATGVITGTPAAAGKVTLTVTLTDATGTQVTANLPLTVNGGLTITTASLPDDGLNVAYSQTLAATGGTAPYTWAITSGSLPAGLTLNSKTGAISGTPTGPIGLSTFTVTATDSTVGPAPLSVQKVFTLNIVAALSITTTALPGGNLGVAYSQTLAATGGRTPYTWSIGSGSLPAGVNLAASTGIISGTPTADGQFSILVVVQDAGGQSARQQLTLVIGGVLTFAPPPAFSATVGTAFSQTLTASGGAPPYTFAVANGTLPAGLALNASSGAITGTPTAPGASTVIFSVTDQRKTPLNATVTITVSLPATPPLTFTLGNATQPPVTLCLGGSFPVAVTATLTLQPFQKSSAVAIGTDTSIQFASPGTGSSVTVTVPPCGSAPPASAAVTMGTVAGTITVSADLTAAGVDITPSSFPPQTITVPPGPPVIQSVTLTPGSGSVTVAVTGYSSTREVSSGNFTFTPATGTTLAQSTIPVTLGPAFTTWYTNPNSDAFGSQFKLTVPFGLSGNASFTAVTVTLANTQGASAPMSSQ